MNFNLWIKKEGLTMKKLSILCETPTRTLYSYCKGERRTPGIFDSWVKQREKIIELQILLKNKEEV